MSRDTGPTGCDRLYFVFYAKPDPRRSFSSDLVILAIAIPQYVRSTE